MPLCGVITESARRLLAAMDTSRTIDAGIDGQGDITGCVPITVADKKFGIRVEIEVKWQARTNSAPRR